MYLLKKNIQKCLTNAPIFSFFSNPKWSDQSNSYEIVAISILTSWLISFVLIVCELGARMTSEFEIYVAEVEQCSWYMLPIELQRMYMVFLSDTQNPVQIVTSYGNITCERETSKRVHLF